MATNETGAADAATRAARDLSERRIVGFACNQAFVFFALFVSSTQLLAATEELFRWDLPCLLLFMVAGFLVTRGLGPARHSRLFARPLLYVYAVVAAVGMLAPVAVVRSALVGVTSALLLTAWGRAFGRVASETSVPEVFLGSLVGALVCLVFSLAADSPVVLGAVCLLPLASVVNIPVGSPAEAAPSAPTTPATETGESSARMLSAKMLAGTVLFGVAAGLMLLHDGAAGQQTLSHYQVSMLLYGAFLIGGLTLLLSDGFGRGAALNKSYRLAVFVMMVGVLLVPWPLLAGSALSGQAVVLAGFLGLEAVLISLFLVLAEISGTDCGLSFSSGFLALFAGELVGVLVELGLQSAGDGAVAHAGVVLAGAAVLLAYVFLFTERDFDELSQLVIQVDSLEAACADISERYGLSNRESEILAFALRGRSSERIAQELFISKSTVDTHLRRIYAKCSIHSRQELLDLANL